ncbi:MAG: SIR2 family protein [Chloroflexi bacterium]|nr:SIR2 family protein [Chloroflexota bacterium]
MAHYYSAVYIDGISREHSIEIFTPNYDLLIEESLERHKVAFFDGFVGSHRPFFDPVSVSSDSLPPRWALLWKLHGSLGWKVYGDSVVRTGLREATELIYPDHLKYDQIGRQPYSALFERLREFLMMPDTLLICSGFSFRDFHIRAVIQEGLAANPHTAVLAFQYKILNEETAATSLAKARHNMSVYAKDGAIISGSEGKWMPGQSPNEAWQEIRRTFWDDDSETNTGEFLLGDFTRLADFLRLIQVQQVSFSVARVDQDANNSSTPFPLVVQSNAE